MKVEVFAEEGYEQALIGLALSYYDQEETLDAFWTEEKRARAAKRAATLAFRHGGHNKFLESIQVWILIQAPRAWWSEMDTYRAGITKQSASTMHTLKKRQTTMDDFEPGTSYGTMIQFNRLLHETKDITRLKMNLPEGYLQTRMVNTNYKTLQHIYAQRHEHKLKQWPMFCTAILEQLEHPEFIKYPQPEA